MRKWRSPCQQSTHIRAAFPICRSRSPIRFHGPPYNYQAPKVRLQFQRDQRLALQISRQSGSRKSQACDLGWRRHLLHGYGSTTSLTRLHGHGSIGSASIPPRPAAGPLKPTRPTSLLKFSAPAGGGAWARHRLAMRRRRRSGARVQAGPKAGACGPGAWIPGEPGQAEPGKNPQARRRIARDGWQITRTRPGVMLAPGLAVPTLSRISWCLVDFFQAVVRLFQ